MDENQMEDIRSDIDQLYNDVEAYRTSENFKKLLDFCVRFRHIAPFNAMLINMQYPGLTAKKPSFSRGIFIFFHLPCPST